MKILISISDCVCIIDDKNGDFVTNLGERKILYYAVGSEDPILVADGFNTKEDCGEFAKKLAVLIVSCNSRQISKGIVSMIVIDGKDLFVCNKGEGYCKIHFYKNTSGMFFIDKYETIY